MANASRKRENGGPKGRRVRRMSIMLSPELIAVHDAAVKAQEAAEEAQGHAVKAQRAAGSAQRAATKAQRAVSLALTKWGLLTPEERKMAFDAERPDLVRHNRWTRKSATARACAVARIHGKPAPLRAVK